MANEDIAQALEREKENLIHATRNFRSHLMTLEREHLQAYSDAVMRSRLAYIRFLDNFIRTLTYQRMPQTTTLLRIANSLLRSELINVEQEEEVHIRRRSVYVSLNDILSQFNNEGGVDDNYLSLNQGASE